MLTSLLPILGSILDKVIPDPKAAGEASGEFPDATWNV